MANTNAVSAVCNAIVHILRASMAEQAASLGLGSVVPTFQVYNSKDFTDINSDRRIKAGASVFLYRSLPNLSHRTPVGRLLPNGQRQFNKLPLDLHLIITIWGEDPNTQNLLVGWVLRTLEDYPVIPTAVLNIGSSTPVFSEDESVELILSEMDGNEMLELWDMLGNGELYYQISIPYLVRNLEIDSQRVYEFSTPVQIRTSDIQRLDGARL